MLTGGSFVASGDLGVVGAVGGAWLGGVLGDQTGYWIGKTAGGALRRGIDKAPKRAALLKKAEDLTGKYGGVGVYLSRWLFSPLGPYVNFAGGATGFGWLKFTLWGVAGEATWVLLYVGLGYTFADRITEVADILSNASGFLAAGLVTVFLGLRLRAVLGKTRR
jgi:membrane protein DedA with SNARE-associated domain